MKYYKQFHGYSEWSEITKEKAEDIILGSFKDNDATRSMLTIPNRIQCMFSTIEVRSEDGMVAAPGLYNLLPDGIEY